MVLRKIANSEQDPAEAWQFIRWGVNGISTIGFGCRPVADPFVFNSKLFQLACLSASLAEVEKDAAVSFTTSSTILLNSRAMRLS